MAVHAVDPAAYRVFYSSYKAYEITGPGVPVLLTVSAALSLALVVFLVVLWSRIARLGRDLSTDALVWASMASTLGFLCASKVLSPQYLLWVLPMAVAGLAVVTRTRPALLRLTVGLIVAAALVARDLPGALRAARAAPRRQLLAVTVLVVRNVLLVALLVQACVRALRLTARRPAAVPPSSPPGPDPGAGATGRDEAPPTRRWTGPRRGPEGAAQRLRSSSPSMPCRPSNW